MYIYIYIFFFLILSDFKYLHTHRVEMWYCFVLAQISKWITLQLCLNFYLSEICTSVIVYILWIISLCTSYILVTLQADSWFMTTDLLSKPVDPRVWCIHIIWAVSCTFSPVLLNRVQTHVYYARICSFLTRFSDSLFSKNKSSVIMNQQVVWMSKMNSISLLNSDD